MICPRSLNQCISDQASAVRVHMGKNSLALSHEGFHIHAQAEPKCSQNQKRPFSFLVELGRAAQGHEGRLLHSKKNHPEPVGLRS